jgi:tetratricopeptide (TPR) repeat protein
LRRIREIGDPVFVPLLETHLEAGKDTVGNLALTRLTLGELYLASGDVKGAGVLLSQIPTDDPLYAIGRIALADHAEASGDPATALSYLEEALATSSEVYVDRDRLDKLRRTVGETAS